MGAREERGMGGSSKLLFVLGGKREEAQECEGGSSLNPTPSTLKSDFKSATRFIIMAHTY